MDRNAPIGVFDSGVGGLTVVRELMEQLPDEQIVYYGDTARVPYGNKSKETVIRYSNQIAEFLCGRNVKAIIVACNTASALALEDLSEKLDIPVIGVVKPGAKAAAAATRNNKIGVIATRATISSGIYGAYLKEKRPEITVYGRACPLFVPLVEEGLTADPITDMIIHRYLDELLEKGIDALVLGCTHYPLLRERIGAICGAGVKLVNPAYETARSSKELLEKMNLTAQKSAGSNRRNLFYVSDSPDQFREFAGNVLGIKIPPEEVLVKTFTD